MTKNSTTWQITTQTIANKINKLATANIKISARTIRNILYSLGYSLYKLTYKPGLTLKAKAVRLKWCEEHKDWILEDWKNVIWSDETSVIIEGQRGGFRVWRLASEAYEKHCIKRC